jgi:Transposase DDE domain
MRTVAFDGTGLQLPDRAPVTGRFPKRSGTEREFGYPLMRLVTLVETGTRAIIAAAFGPESDGELAYAARLLDRLEANMLVLADAGFNAIGFLRGIHTTGAQFLVRSSATRRPLVQYRLPDGSYLTRLSAPYRAGHGYGMLTVRVIEAWITVKLADGTVRRGQWRLITSLTDPAVHPAERLVTLYHERWQAETAYASLKASLLDGRVLRSGHPADLNQELWGILTVYQALIHTASDAAAHRPGLDMDRLSFTVALHTARDQVTTASGILPSTPSRLVGTIGRAVPCRPRRSPVSRPGLPRSQHHDAGPARRPRLRRARRRQGAPGPSRSRTWTARAATGGGDGALRVRLGARHRRGHPTRRARRWSGLPRPRLPHRRAVSTPTSTSGPASSADRERPPGKRPGQPHRPG